MKNILMFVTSLLITMSSFGQVKLNVWDKSAASAQTLNKMSARNLPANFESKTPDGDIEIYDRWNVKSVKVETSDGKKFTHTPIAYKGRRTNSVITFTSQGWTGMIQTKQGRSYSMTPNSVQIDTITKNALQDYCGTALPLKQTTPSKSNTKPRKEPPVGRLTTSQFYNPSVPINKIPTIYVEVSYLLHQNLGGNLTTTNDWVTNLVLGVKAVYALEGITVELNKTYVWTTPDPYTSVPNNDQTSGTILGLFNSNINQNSPTNPESDYKHFLSERPIGGIAYLPYYGDVGNGYDLPQPSSILGPEYWTAVSGIPSPTLPTSPTNISQYNFPIYVFSHEMGHNMGSKHSHWCGWKNDLGVQIGRLDSCGSGINEQGTGPINICGTNSSYSPKPTIMSYCHNKPPNGTILSNGFGKYPRFAIRTVLYYNQIPFSSVGLPAVTTSAVSSVGINSATCGGNVTSDGGGGLLSRGVVWSLNPNPTIDLTTKTQDGFSSGVFTSSLANLAPNTTYYIRAYVQNSAGTSYGNQLQFTTLPAVIPSLTTTSVTAITNNTATSGGNVTSNGGSSVTSRGVVWSTSPSPTIALTTKTSNGTGNGTFSSSLTGLSSSTTYYVRSYATNIAGTAYGNELTFSTVSASSVLIETRTVNVTSYSAANSGGIITSDGGAAITARGVCWSTTQNPTITNSKTSNGTGTGTYTSNLSGLVAGTTYYLRAYATNANGTTYGQQQTFTVPIRPTVVALAATNIGQNTVTLPVTISNVTNGFIQLAGVEITGQNYNNAPSVPATTSGTYQVNVSNLQTSTTYTVRGYAYDNFESVIYSTNSITFTTLAPSLPTVVTNAATLISTSSITQSRASISGKVTSSSIAEDGVVFNTTGNPDINSQKITYSNYPYGGSGTVSGTVNLTNLTPKTTYYAKWFGRNAAGIAYGNQITFTTPAYVVAPTVGLPTITNISQTGARFSSTVINNSDASDVFCPESSDCRGFVISKTVTSPSLIFSQCNSGAPNYTPTCGAISEDPNSQVLGGTFSAQCNSCVLTNAISLEPNTTYNVRAYVRVNFNSPQGTVYYSGTRSFTTLSGVSAPTVSTGISGPVSPVTSTTSGIQYHTVVSNNGSAVTSRGVVWSTSPNPTTSLVTKITSGSGSGDYGINITGLTPSTTYYYRAFAINSVGTSYGIERTFTTLGSTTQPTVSTTAVSSITSTTAVSGGNVTLQGGSAVTSRGICYATSQNPTLSNSVVTSGSGTGTFTANLTGLTSGTTYYVRAYATNGSGTAFGTQVSFTTLSLPTLTTTGATSITATTASTGGNVTSDGRATITERGVCYATTTLPTTGNLKFVASGTTGSYTTILSNLLPSTTYYVRAYAINSVGTQYGSEISFTTTAQQTTPTVTTTSPTSITTNTASSGGSVTSEGNSTVTARGVVWSTLPEPTVTLTTKTSNGTGPGSFTSSITGISPGVLYYVRAYATNSVGTSYGSEFTFTTLTTTPTLASTDAASSVTQTTATSGGNITSDGGSSVTARGVVWSTSQNPTVILTTKTDEGSGNGSFTSNIFGLNPGTTYFVRSYATNANGTSYGSQVSFTTVSATSLATVTTTTASSITLTTAQSGGQVVSDGGTVVTSRGVVWSTSPNPTVSLTTKTQDGTGQGIFSSSITGLTSATLYYYRAYATNSNGTAYGTQLTFTTSASLPSLTTSPVSSITLTSGVSGGNISSDGGASITARGVVWSTSVNPTIDLITKTNNGTGLGAFSSNITGLTQNTTYYVRAYATNSAGTQYGNQVTFTTSSTSLPSVVTTSPSSIDFTSAVSGGNVTSDGNSTVTVRGVCWSESENPTLSNSFSINGTGTGSFTSNLTDLSPGTTYYVRAYATNSVGTAYGNQVSLFTTVGQAPELTTDVINNVTSTNAEIVYSIVSLGGGTLTEKGFVYSTSPNPTTSNFKQGEACAIETPCEIGQYTAVFLTSLSSNTTYYVRAYAMSEFGTSYGQELSFTTLIDSPTLTTSAISGITSTSAISGGSILNTGGGSISAKGVCWSTSPNPTISNSFTTDGSGPNPFSSSITGLSPGILYYVRAYATNQNGTNYGNQLTFTTTSVNLPTLTTIGITSVTATTATSGGNITSDGGSTVTARGVVWSTSQNPTLANNRTSDGSGIGSYSSSLTGLIAGTTYYVRSYATTSAGTSYGQQNIFTTSSSTPSVSTTSASGTTSTSSTSGGNVTNSGGQTVTARGVVWSTSPNPTIALSTKTTNGSGLGSFSSSITGLTPSTTYYVRAYATNSVGTGYGNEITITTSSSGTGSCAITNLTREQVNSLWNFTFDINPNCTSYTVNVCRYLNSNPAVPPTAGQTPERCAIRNDMSSYVPTAGEISAGFITRVMSGQPAISNRWYSVDVTCNGTCTGTKTTRSAYFYYTAP